MGLQDESEGRNYVLLWQELTRYVGFLPEHARALSDMREAIEPHFQGIVTNFYEAIENDPAAAAVFVGGHAQIERQKGFLSQWMHEVFSGQYDEAYILRHARIGRTHVSVGMNQRYVYTAMNLVRDGFHLALDQMPFPADKGLRHQAIDKVCDLEVAIMSETYAENHMEEMRRKERLATLGQVAGFVGHELRNPLAVMETSLHLLRKRVPQDDERAERHLRRLSEQVALSSGIISGLLELTRDREPQREVVALREAIESGIASIPGRERFEIDVQVDEAAEAPRLDPQYLRHLVVNIVTNAIQALAEKGSSGHVWVTGHRSEGDLVLTVADDGPGLDPQVIRELFKPLRTTRAKGLGLGLALCRKIAEKHGGRIEARVREGGGAQFDVVLAAAFGEEP